MFVVRSCLISHYAEIAAIKLFLLSLRSETLCARIAIVEEQQNVLVELD